MILKLLRNRRGAVSLIGAIALPVLLGVTGLAAEYGNALATRVDNQRIADLAAYSGALAYNYSNQQSDMTAAVTRVANFNNVATANVNSALVTSPNNAAKSAVKVTVTTSVPLVFSRFITSASSQSVPATAYAEMSRDAAACVIGLSTATGNNVSLSGGTKINAPACTVASNKQVNVPCGTTISAITVAYDNSVAPLQPCSGISAPVVRKVTADPLLTHAGIAAARARLSYVQNLDWPGHPGVPVGKNIDFGWDQAATKAQIAAVGGGCTGTFSGSTSTWTMTCTGTTLSFGSITLAGGQSLNFNTGSAATTVYQFSGHIMNTNGGDTMRFGKGIYRMDGGIMNDGNGKIIFNTGDFWIGTLPKDDSRCDNNIQSICNNGNTISFGAGTGQPSKFLIACGIYNHGGGYMSFGDGIGNSYKSGVSRTQYAINMKGGSTTIFADMSGNNIAGTPNLFELAGKIVTDGGSCLIIGAATNHDNRAYIDASGAVIMGAGNWTVAQYAWFGNAQGGNVNCGGSSVGIKAIGVSFYAEGAGTPTTGLCANQAFCIAAGYSNVEMTAPTAGDLAKIVVFGSASSGQTQGALFAQGASGVSLSGAFYMPNGPVALTGGATVGDKTGQCLTLIGKTITLAGGTVAASACVDSTASAQVALVQ